MEFSNNNRSEEYINSRINNLRKVIIELSEHCAKKAIKRLVITVTIISVLIFLLMMQNADSFEDFLYIIPSSVVSSCVLLFVIYGISSFTFTKAKHETMIIEKLKTELSILSNEPEHGIDMTLEIGKLRDSI